MTRQLVTVVVSIPARYRVCSWAYWQSQDYPESRLREIAQLEPTGWGFHLPNRWEMDWTLTPTRAEGLLYRLSHARLPWMDTRIRLLP